MREPRPVVIARARENTRPDAGADEGFAVDDPVAVPLKADARRPRFLAAEQPRCVGALGRLARRAFLRSRYARSRKFGCR